jgi:Family of unknown function (DUF6174)
MLRFLKIPKTVERCADLVLILVITVACNTEPSRDTTSQDDIVSEAQSQRKQWNEQKVRRYDVTYVLIEGDDSVKPAYRLVKAINNGVLDTTCPNGICPTLHLRNLRTIPDLFTLIIDSAGVCDLSVVYDARRHYPTIVRANCGSSGKPDFRVIVQGLALEP